MGVLVLVLAANAHRPSECKSLGADPEVGIDNACFSSLYVKYRTEDQLRDDFQKVFSSALGATVVSVCPLSGCCTPMRCAAGL